MPQNPSNFPDASKFAESVRIELDQIGKSSCWLARETGISQCMISYYLTGKAEPSLSKAIKISQILKTPLSRLIGEDILNSQEISSYLSQSPKFKQNILHSYSSSTLLEELDRRMKE